MALPVNEFDLWVRAVRIPNSTPQLADAAGVKVTTLRKQRLRGRVSEQVVVNIARSFQLSPVAALSAFNSNQPLRHIPLVPTTDELLSQTSHIDLLVELLSRNDAGLAQTLGAQYRMSAIPHSESVRSWLDAIDRGNLRRDISRHTSTAESNLSAMITENRLSLEIAFAAADISGVSPVNGLVVSGLVTPDEALWPPHGREKAVADMDDLDLLDFLESKLKALRRRVEKKANAQKFRETLG